MKFANIVVSLIDGQFDVSFDCSGAKRCEFALCEFMPPETDDGCCFKKYGVCTNPESRQAAMKSIRIRIKHTMTKEGSQDE